MGTLLIALVLQTPQEIRQAVRKGVEVLRSAEGELGLWALAHAGAPDAALKPKLDAALKEAPSTTRAAAIQALTLEEIDPAKYYARIAHCAQQLIDTQCRDGLWDDGKAVERVEIELPRPNPKGPVAFGGPVPPRFKRQALARRAEGGEKGDLSRTRWALWGLVAAERVKVIAPAELAEKADAALRKAEGDAAELLSCLCISDFLRGRDWKKDPDVLKAVERLAAEKRTSPEALYLLNRAMIHFDSELLGGVRWWDRDVRILLDTQKPDGSWGDGTSTAYAVLVLHARP